MEIDRTLIGAAAPDFVVEVEKGAVRAFAQAIGDDHPAFQDETYARRCGYPGLVAPPTFPTSFRPPQRQPWMQGLDEGRILAGEQYFHYERPIFAGDVLTCSLRFVRLDEKRGRSGLLQFIVQELQAKDVRGQLVVTNGRVVIYRGRSDNHGQ